jgi:catechol 2,3-dioxygenase-like lactoylglutathione lyase family enzyme
LKRVAGVRVGSAVISLMEALMKIEKISAVTFRVANMRDSVRFYRDVLGMELVYGGEDSGFSSLRAKDVQSAVLNLELGHAVTGCR